jgi:hypothetical protein
VTDRAWGWRDELEALLRTRWSVDDLDQLLESLAQDPAVTDDEYLAAQAEINALAAGNGHPEQPVTAEALASGGVTVEQHQRLLGEHEPADQVGTQELVDQAVTSVETHDHPSGRAAEAGRDGDSEADPERARAEQLNHWRSDDEARTRGSSIEEDTDAAQDGL